MIFDNIIFAPPYIHYIPQDKAQRYVRLPQLFIGVKHRGEVNDFVNWCGLNHLQHINENGVHVQQVLFFFILRYSIFE